MARAIIEKLDTVIERTIRSWAQDLGRWLVEEISEHGARRAADRLDAKARDRESTSARVPDAIRGRCDRTTARLRRCATWLREHAEEVGALDRRALLACGNGLPELARRVLPTHGYPLR